MTTRTTSFVDDGDGGRVTQWTNALGGFGTTTFIGSSYERAPDGTTTKYIFAGSQRIASKTSTGTLRFYHGDHLGSSNVITDGTGARVELAEYTPYGSLNRREGTTNVPQKFTGKRLDSTGLYFYEARYYDPSLGRFVTADPTIQRMGDPQDLNRYSYARNNPLKYTDPTGHGWFKKLGKALLAAVLAVVTIFLFAIPGGQPAAVLTAKATYLAAASAAGATLTLDTGEGRQFQGHLAKEVFDDAFGMRPRAAAFTAGMVSHTVVASAFYVGLTTAFPEPGTGTDFTQQANQGRLIRNAPRGSQPGGDSAIKMHEAHLKGNAGADSTFLKEGLVGSDIAFQETPVVGTLFRAINARHAAFTRELSGGLFFDSTQVNLRAFPRLYGTPWTGISHQTFFNSLIAAGLPGLQAIGRATTQAGWSFYLSSSLYGVNGGYGVSGIAHGLVNADQRR